MNEMFILLSYKHYFYEWEHDRKWVIQNYSRTLWETHSTMIVKCLAKNLFFTFLSRCYLFRGLNSTQLILKVACLKISEELNSIIFNSVLFYSMVWQTRHLFGTYLESSWNPCPSWSLYAFPAHLGLMNQMCGPFFENKNRSDTTFINHRTICEIRGRGRFNFCVDIR